MRGSRRVLLGASALAVAGLAVAAYSAVSSDGTQTPETSSSAPVEPPGRIWVDPDHLMSRPVEGRAWQRLKARADSDLGEADIADQDSDHDIDTLAVALVAARTQDPAYFAKARAALMDVIGTDENRDRDCEVGPDRARALSLGRNLPSYVIAADLIGLRPDADPRSEGSRFAAWVDTVRFKPNCPNVRDGEPLNLSEEHDSSGSNGSAMAGAARIAAAAYLGDDDELDAAWDTYRRYSGDRSVGPDLTFNEPGLSWAADEDEPVAINPAGSTKDGHRIDGAIINDIGRGDAFDWPPEHTQYHWEGTAGYYVQAQLLDRAGYDSWNVSDDAPRRVMEFNRSLAEELGDEWWDHTDWAKYLANFVYGLDLPISGPADEGKNMAWTDWLFGE
ncbi:MAG: hypothetical protein ACOYXM_10785 [Actinomycetota bacterium]